MSFLTAVTGRENRSTNLTASGLKDPALVDWFGGRQTVSGAHITPQSAMQISGWYAGVRILSETIASLPMITYKRLSQGKERAVNHANYPILHDAPNSMMTAMEFIECMQAWCLGWGNAFAEIERDGRGVVKALWPIPPSCMRVQKINGRLWYYARILDPNANGMEVQFRQDDILHIRGLTGDGILGFGVVDLMREAIGLAKVEEEYRARFFQNNAVPSGIIEYPGELSKEGYERYKSDWQKAYGGLGNQFRIAFLESGLKYHETMFTPQAAEFIEGRKFQLEEIARILGIPLILLQSTEKATSWGTGIEQFLLAFATFTIRPWLKRWEARLNYSLFTEIERKSFFVEALLEDLLRADSMTRAQVLQIWRRNGIINADDWLALENRNPLPNGQGKKYLVEANMTTLELVGQPPPAPEATPNPDDGDDTMQMMMNSISHALESRHQPAPQITVNNPPINIDIAPPAITIESREQPPAQITVNTPPVYVDVAPAAITIESREQPPAQITVNTPDVHVDIAPPSITVERTNNEINMNPTHNHPPVPRTRLEKIVTERDARGLIVRVEEREIAEQENENASE